MSVPAMARLAIFRSGAQWPQRQQPARRHTRECPCWKQVTMRRRPSVRCAEDDSGAACCGLRLRCLRRQHGARVEGAILSTRRGS